MSVQVALALLAGGALLRSAGLIGEAEAGSSLATYLTLPCLALRVFSGLHASGASDFTASSLSLSAFAASLSALLAAAAAALVVFAGRRKPERALLTSAAVGSGGGLFEPFASPSAAYGHAVAFSLALAGDAALPFALSWSLADAAASLFSSRVLLGSWGGDPFPESYEHADGGLYSGEWGSPYRSRTAFSSPSDAAAAATASAAAKTDAPASASKQGLGVYRYPSGARYEGQWHAGVKSGRGVYLYPKGGRYEGEWRDGVPDGVGVRIFSKKKKSDSTAPSTEKIKAGFWRGGSFEGPLPLWQCADAAAGAREAARAARSLSLGGSGVGAAVRSFLTQPLLWGVVLGFALRFLRSGEGLSASLFPSSPFPTSASPSALVVLGAATRAAADAHVPLSLLLSGAAAFGASPSLFDDAFNNADAAASLGVKAAASAAAVAAVAAVASTTTTTAITTTALAVSLACSLSSPVPADLPALAVRFRVNDAAAAALARWSSLAAPLLSGAAVSLLLRSSSPSLRSVAAVSAAFSAASAVVAAVARQASLSRGREAAFAARALEREAEEAEAAKGATKPSPSSAVRAAAQARAAAISPKPGVGFAGAGEIAKGEEEKRKGSNPFRDVEEGFGGEGGSGSGTSALPRRRRQRSSVALPGRSNAAVPPLRRHLSRSAKFVS